MSYLGKVKKPITLDVTKTQVFSMRMVKKNWGVTPLIGILGVTITGVAAVAMHFLLHKPNVRLNRRARLYPYEYVEGHEVRRFWMSPYFGAHGPIPEVEQLKKEIGPRRYPMHGDEPLGKKSNS